MSRQNKVNPGMYTQRGRLTQDDVAREWRKQSALGSPHTWQPVKARANNRIETEAVSSNATAKPAKAKTAGTGKAKRTTGNAKTGKAVTPATRRPAARPTRKAVLARNAGGRVAAPRATAKRRKR